MLTEERLKEIELLFDIECRNFEDMRIVVMDRADIYDLIKEIKRLWRDEEDTDV